MAEPVSTAITLAKIFGLIKGGGEALGSISRGVGSLIPSSDKESIRAAELQQNIETTARQIEERVLNGTLSPDAAINALKSLQTFAAGLGGSTALNRAAQMANLIISQVMANVEEKRNTQLTAPFRPGEGIAGSPEFQRQRVGTGIRNLLTGGRPGDFLKDSPIGGLIKPFDVLGQLPQVREETERLFPRREDEGSTRDRILNRFLRKI